MRTISTKISSHDRFGSWAGIACRAAAFSLIVLFAMALPAPAQTNELAGEPSSHCAKGLMRRDEAASGTLLLKTTTPGCYLGAPRVGADITVDIAGPVARTRVTQRFENPSDGWVEGVYLFPLPEGAAVDTLKMQVGDRFIEGEIKERQQARQIYEQARAEGRVASLVEQDRPNVFTNQVANIAPHATVIVQIEYQESVPFDRDNYRLRIPLVVAPRYSPEPRLAVLASNDGVPVVASSDPVPDRERLDAPVLRPEWGKTNPVNITVNLEAGFPVGQIASTSHAVTVARMGATHATIRLRNDVVPADRDFTLNYSAARSAAPSVSLLREKVGSEDYLLALVVPPAAGQRAAPKPREAIFVLDNSGSMAGESIVQAKASLLLALSRLKPADRFNVIRFDDTFTVLFPTPVAATPQNVATAKGFVEGINADGGTEMLAPLLAALTDATPNDQSHLRQVIFLTDGEVGNEAELFSAIGSKLGRSRLFTVGIGSAPNGYFMAGAARAGRGTYTYIGSAEEVVPRMAELFAKLERPVMTNLTARWPQGGAETWPNPLPDLYAGEPVVLTAKAANMQGALVLAGNLDGKPWQVTLDLRQAREARGVERLWARHKIASLEESRVRGADESQIDKAVLAVALSHHLTSRLTSLVAVDVTPSRPANAQLASAQVPLNLPAGWDFDKVFGERQRVRDADVDVPEELLDELAASREAYNAVRPQAEHLDLPQGGTDSRLLLLIGLLLLSLGFVVTRVRIPVRGA